MRWVLMLLVMTGCGSATPVCSDLPLGGDCLRVSGWQFVAHRD